LGDRSEAFAAAIASVYLNIPFAHINGGDISGTTLDESIRHCITKLAHIHFVHTKENALRVKKMGEENERIFISGALTLDTIVNKKLIGKKNIFKKYNLDTEQTTFLVIFHPITTLSDYGLSQLTQLFSALKSLKKQTIVIYPNNDAGSRQFIEFIEQNRCKDFLHIFKNLPYIDYLSLMKSCDVMIGNSSSGIIEAPSFQVPVINIGNRQQGRQRSDNILDVEPDEKEILEAIDFALNDVRFKEIVNQSSNTFGDGTASDKIVNVLKQINLSEKLIQKQITY
jgi:UDP-N-acetylglucosamine 2-epimerase (non-hydrolysing)/GDP/UDP-N,N'-diacetylbacillosamine 2-epimerase (hydrolysing)